MRWVLIKTPYSRAFRKHRRIVDNVWITKSCNDKQ